MSYNSISTLIKKIHGNPLDKRNKALITFRPYLTICNVALGRSQRPTGRLPAKPNFKEVWRRQNLYYYTLARQSIADCLHSQDYLTQVKGFEIHGQIQG